MICLEIDTLSSLPFSEQVDYAQTIEKIHKRQSVFKTSTHGFYLLLQHVRVMKHILITTVKYFLARLFQSMHTLLQKCSNSFSLLPCNKINGLKLMSYNDMSPWSEIIPDILDVHRNSWPQSNSLGPHHCAWRHGGCVTRTGHHAGTLATLSWSHCCWQKCHLTAILQHDCCPVLLKAIISRLHKLR